MKRTIALVVATLVFVALSPDPAAAQNAGQQIYGWFMANLWFTMALVLVVGVGLAYLFGAIGFRMLAAGVAGGAVVKFAPDIAAFFV